METGGFEHHVFKPAGLDGVEQFVGLLNRAEHRRNGGGNVFAVFEHLEAMPRVAGRVGGDEHRLDAVILDQFLERGIRPGAAGGFGQPGAPVRNQITDRHHLDVRVILKTKDGPKPANAIADQPNTNLPLGHGFPPPRSIRGRRCFLEALNDLFFLAGSGGRNRQRGGPEPERLQK